MHKYKRVATLGYLIGNNYVEIRHTMKNIFLVWIASIAIQIVEGYGYYLMGDANCGTQLKLSAILSGSIFCLMSYVFVMSNKTVNMKLIEYIGDISFGIYFSHVAIMKVLWHIPGYNEYIIYPLNAVITIFISGICVWCGKRMLGKYSRCLAL